MIPADERSSTAILATSAGEIEAIDLYSPAYGLPTAISGGQYGYGDLPPTTVLVVGFGSDLLSNFEDCTLVAPITTPFDVQNDETINHRSIYLCHNLRLPWPDFWQQFQYFG